MTIWSNETKLMGGFVIWLSYDEKLWQLKSEKTNLIFVVFGNIILIKITAISSRDIRYVRSGTQSLGLSPYLKH